MNILQIVSSARVSGAEKHVIVLADWLRRRGHHVTALCPPGGWLSGQLRDVGVPVMEMKMHGLRSWATPMRLTQFVRDNNIDLIHSHLTCATYYGFLSGRLAQRPVVSSVHVLTHDFVYRKLLPRRNNRIITVSDCVRDYLLGQGVPDSHLRTIYNGTDFFAEENSPRTLPSPQETLSPLSSYGEQPMASLLKADNRTTQDQNLLPVRAELSLPPDAEVIGLIARVGEFKGHPILVQSVRKVVEARPRAYFVCVGAVEPQMQRSLWEMAGADGVAERLRFTGVRNDVSRLMEAMDVVTLPSRFEACSMSIIEAMAMGKPVIATRAGGNPELVQEGETGLLIERTPEALANALISVLSDSSTCQRMGEAARNRAKTRFSANVMVGHIEALYREMLET